MSNLQRWDEEGHRFRQRGVDVLQPESGSTAVAFAMMYNPVALVIYQESVGMRSVACRKVVGRCSMFHF